MKTELELWLKKELQKELQQEKKKELKKEQKEWGVKDVTKIAGDSFAPYEKDDNGW